MSSDQFDDNLIGSGRAPLVSRGYINDVLRNLNIKEGLFSEQDLREIENGYSVSETDDDHDVLSVQSNHHLVGSIQSPDLYELNRHMHRGSQNHLYQEELKHNGDNVEQRIRHQQERSVLQSEIVNQKSKYIRKMTDLEKLIEQLRSEKRQLQQVLETQKQNFKFQLLQQEQKTAEQLKEIKEQQSKLKDEVPQFKDKLEQYKKELNSQSLLVSEETYVELKAKQEEKRSLKEYIQVKVYESLEKYQRELESLRRENDELVEENMNIKIKNDRDMRELDSLKKVSREREEDSRRRVDALERRNKELEADLHKLNQQYKVILDRGVGQRELDERAKQLEIDNRTFQNQNKMLEDQILKLQDSKHEVERRSESLRREIDILNQDKTFLTRENTSLEERVKRLEDKLDRTEEELLESKKSAQKYMERVLNTNDDVKSKFDQQYSREIQELKDRHNKELELSKQNLIDIYEKKIDYMRERKDESERRVTKLEQDLKDKSKSYEEILIEFRQLQRAGDEELGHLKLQVRSKGDELQRINHLYEDNMVLVKELKMENEALKQKIDILKSEYYKLESTGRQNNADMKAELAVCKERLANYEMIEKELDQAIMNVAQNDTIDEDGTNAIGNALISTITSAPTTAKRRIQQSLLLANRLQGKQKEVEACQQEIKQLKEKIENYENEMKLHKRLLDKTNQPYSYMIADIERAEKELNFAQKKIKQLEDALKKLKAENDQLKLQKKGLNDDLQKLVARRQDIENLQTTLQGLIMHSTAKKIDVDELKMKLAESLRANKYKGECSSPVKKEKENIMKRLNRSKSRSPTHHNYLDEVPEKGTVKMYQETDSVPAWYKTLKRQVGK